MREFAPQRLNKIPTTEAPITPLSIILQLPTPVTIRSKAPIKTKKTEVSATDPGIEPINMLADEYATSPLAAKVPKMVSPEIPSTLLASETHTLSPDIKVG